jgi:hypothetical protein
MLLQWIERFLLLRTATRPGSRGPVRVDRIGWILLAYILLGGVLPTPGAYAQSPTMASGRYGPAALALDPHTGLLTGVVDAQRGRSGDESASCVFFLLGVPTGDRYRLTTWHPPSTSSAPALPGTLVPGDDAASVRIRLEQVPDGCGRVNPFLARGEGDTFRRDGPATDWIAVRFVAADRAYFHDAPAPDQQRSAYVVRGDVVTVQTRRPGWVRATFHGSQGRTTGWIRAGDLFAVLPPSTD